MLVTLIEVHGEDAKKNREEPMTVDTIRLCGALRVVLWSGVVEMLEWFAIAVTLVGKEPASLEVGPFATEIECKHAISTGYIQKDAPGRVEGLHCVEKVDTDANLEDTE